MSNTDADIVAVLLKSVYEKGLISEMTYRNSLHKLRTLDNAPQNQSAAEQRHDTEGCQTHGH